MFKYHCLNPLSQTGLDSFTTNYSKTEDINDADAIIVRSAKMHEIELNPKTVCVARAGAGVNNIPLDKYADQGMTIDKPPVLPVKECLRLIRDIEKGKTESATIHQNNGARDVPAFLCKPAVIDKTNLESVHWAQ